MPTTKVYSGIESCPISSAILQSGTPSAQTSPLSSNEHCTHVPPLLLEAFWMQVATLLDILDTHHLSLLDQAASDLRLFMLEIHTINLINSPAFKNLGTLPPPPPEPTLPPRSILVREALRRHCPFIVEHYESAPRVTYHKRLINAKTAGRGHSAIVIAVDTDGTWGIQHLS